jgi:hypothetical protein
VDVQEVRKLDAYLKRLFGNARIRVVPRPQKDDSAEVYIGEDFVAVLFVDDEDDERSYNFQMAVPSQEHDSSPNIQETKKVETCLRRLFNNARIRVQPRPKKDDSAEVYIGEEFIGVLFADDEGKGSYNFNMGILATDLG